jgi:hypothetical protein
MSPRTILSSTIMSPSSIYRGGMIQTHEQYEFIHQALCEYEKELAEPEQTTINGFTGD